jgi:hypothetical protein
MERFDWARLTPLQVGKYAEYLTKMEFTLWGFDVFTSEVDEHGVDFVARHHPGPYYDVQVKSARGLNHIFFRKDKFGLRPNLLAAIVLFNAGQLPHLYLIPSVSWKTPTPLLVDRTYEDKKSKPEWGINLSTRNMPQLEAFSFEKTIAAMSGVAV